MKETGGEAPLRYRYLSEQHLPAVMTLETQAYPDPWTHGMFRQEIDNGASHFFLALRENRLVGYGGFWLVTDEAHLTKLTVAEQQRRTRLGTRIMLHLLREAALAGAKMMLLEVRESNTPARCLYEKLGFARVGLRKGYYARSNEAAVVMTRRVPMAGAR